MVGVVLITHGEVGEKLMSTTESIVGRLDRIQCVSINIKERDKVNELRKAIATAVKKVDLGQGVLILTDMFGGTPSNISLSFLEEGRVEVLSGVNLPMLLKLCNLREKKGLMELTKIIKEHAQKSIVLASDVLKGKKQQEN